MELRGRKSKERVEKEEEAGDGRESKRKRVKERGDGREHRERKGENMEGQGRRK